LYAACSNRINIDQPIVKDNSLLFRHYIIVERHDVRRQTAIPFYIMAIPVSSVPCRMIAVSKGGQWWATIDRLSEQQVPSEDDIWFVKVLGCAGWFFTRRVVESGWGFLPHCYGDIWQQIGSRGTSKVVWVGQLGTEVLGGG
jgi:hypothetical protein